MNTKRIADPLSLGRRRLAAARRGRRRGARADEPARATARGRSAPCSSPAAAATTTRSRRRSSPRASARARVEWTVVHEGGSSSNHRVSVYEQPNWAANYDVIVHNECFSAVTDKEFIEKALAPHRAGVGAVVIHCAMHTFRDLKTDEWREFLGVDTRGHGPQHPLEVKNLKPDNPIMKGFPASGPPGTRSFTPSTASSRPPRPLAEAPENGKQHTVHLDQHLRPGARLRHHDRPQQQDDERPGLPRPADPRPPLVGRPARRQRPAQGRVRRLEVNGRPVRRPASSVTAVAVRRVARAGRLAAQQRTVFRSRAFSSVNSITRATTGSSTSR